MAKQSLHGLRYLESIGQQGEVAMSTAVFMSKPKFQSKFPTYAPPPKEKEGMLSVIDAAQELQRCLAQCPRWDRRWQMLGEKTRQAIRVRARNPKRLGRLDYLLERGLEGTTTVGESVRQGLGGGPP